MSKASLHQRVLLGLLLLWGCLEILKASGWSNLLFGVRPGSSALPQQLRPGSLTALLKVQQQARNQPIAVWLAPYITYPETGFIESDYRASVYDNLTLFSDFPLRLNYGYTKLSPMDTLAAQASLLGLGYEEFLARDVGFSWFAVDLGALQQPDAARRHCRTRPHCQETSDHYLLWSLMPTKRDIIPGPAHAVSTRRILDLPFRSAAPSCPPFVFNEKQWGLDRQSGLHHCVVVAKAVDGAYTLYSYPTPRYPRPFWSALEASRAGALLRLGPGIQFLRLQICAAQCSEVTLSARQPTLRLAAWLKPGAMASLRIDQVQAVKGTAWPLRVEVPIVFRHPH